MHEHQNMNVKWMGIRELEDPYAKENYFRKLSEERKEKALQFRKEEDQLRSIAAGWLLENEFRREGIREEYHYEYSELGKPTLYGHPEICFSITHCKTHAACAVSDRKIGIDMETIADDSRNLDKILRYRNITDSVKDWINSAEEKEERMIRFLRFWTLSEALVKVRDMPLMKVLQDLEASDLKVEETFSVVRKENVWEIHQMIREGCMITVAKEAKKAEVMGDISECDG